MILVTGATGFVGAAVVRRLLADGRRVVALARPRDGEGAVARVAASVGRATDGEALRVVAGDLVAPGAGLAAPDVAWLRRAVRTVIHCAGDTAFVSEAPATFRRGHVDGPRALLARLAGGRLRRFAHVSTAFVCGRREGVVHEADGAVGQTFHNAYERVKLEAEGALREASRARGIELTVLRPGVVVGDAPRTAGGLPSALLFDFIRLVAALGDTVRVRIPARPAAPFNIVRVDDAARVIAALGELPAAAGQTAHVVVPGPPTQAEMLALISARLGVDAVRLVDGPPPDPTREERFVLRMLNGYRDYLTQDVRFDDTTARRLLDAAHVHPPTLGAAEVDALIDHALAAATHGDATTDAGPPPTAEPGVIVASRTSVCR